jgi:hypothetical protein
MKKAYKKPMMIVEWFTLSQTIATGCGENAFNWGTPKHERKAVCAWDLNDTGMLIFQDPNICELASEDWGVVCYNAPADGNNVFHS